MSAITKAKMAISKVSDLRDLDLLRAYIRERSEIIGKRKYEAALAEAKIRMQFLEAGTRLWCCAQGTFLGGNLQRGDEFEVSRTMCPRLRTLWAKHIRTGKTLGFSVGLFHRYDLRPEKPENPVDDETRERLRRMNERLSSVVFGGGK